MKDFAKIFGFFYRQYRRETAVVIGLVVLAGLAEALGVAAFLPFFQIVLEGEASFDYIPAGRLRDFVLGLGIEPDFASVSLFIAGAIAIKACILWFSLRVVSLTVARIAADLRARLLGGLVQANWRFFVNHSMGTSLNAVINETFRASTAFVSVARFIFALVQFSIYAVGAYLLSWQVFFATMAVGVLLGLALWALVRAARRAGGLQTDLARDMMNQMAEMLQGIKPLRAMALEKNFTEILARQSRGLERAQADQLISTQAMRVYHEPLMVATAIGGLYLAMTFGGLASSALAVMAVIFIRLLGSLNNAQNEYQRLMIQESALWSLLDTIGQIEAAADVWPGSSAPPARLQSLVLEGASFSHEDKAVLSGAGLAVVPRTLTALIGPSGGGKTTVLDLISGFQRPQAGSILVNGINLAALDLRQWRQQIGFVPQDVFLFNDTILENIRVGRSEITEQDVWHALEQVGARAFVESRPEGLHAPVGEAGRGLSGGQKQRLAIARAIVHRPQILLLDEATSALDRDTEALLLETLKKLAQDMTVIFVSHNAAVLGYADAVYRVEGGAILPQLQS